MAVRTDQFGAEAMGLLIGGGIIVGHLAIDVFIPPADTTGITQALLEVLTPPVTHVSASQVLMETLEGFLDPLLGQDGNSAIPFDFPATLSVSRGAVLSTEDQQRHTRVVFERVGGTRRLYHYTIHNATGAEVELVRQALAQSRGGAVHVLFRSPVDDPVNLPAVRYRILNAGAVSEQLISRHAGGSLGEITLELEEV